MGVELTDTWVWSQRTHGCGANGHVGVEPTGSGGKLAGAAAAVCRCLSCCPYRPCPLLVPPWPLPSPVIYLFTVHYCALPIEAEGRAKGFPAPVGSRPGAVESGEDFEDCLRRALVCSAVSCSKPLGGGMVVRVVGWRVCGCRFELDVLFYFIGRF